MRARFATVLALALVTAALAALPALADWPALGRDLTDAIGDQQIPQVTTDGNSGAIVAWQDGRGVKSSIFARRVLASGDLDPAWPVDGLSVLSDQAALASAFAGQTVPVIVADGSGGAIVAWQDGRSQANGSDIFAEHILKSGVVDPAWPVNGRALATVRGEQELPQIVSDGAGGAIVCWMDSRSGVTGPDIFAQHVLANGTVDPAWPVNGVSISSAPGGQSLPKIVSDGAAGAIVTWQDLRSGTADADIFAQHVKSNGVIDPAWPADGRALTLAAGTQVNPSIVADGLKGAIVAWEDARDGSNHIFAQHVLGSGAIAPGWPADGLIVSNASGGEVQPLLASDGRAPGTTGSGAIVTWRDPRNASNHRPFAEHVLATGSVDPAWPINGRALTGSTVEETDASIVTDGGGGAIVAWEEGPFVFVNRVTATGQLDPTFPANGRRVRLVNTFQRTPELVAAGGGPGTAGSGAIVAWADNFPGADSNILANVVQTQATAGVDPSSPGAGLALSRGGTNPSRGPVTLSYALPHDAAVRLDIYDVTGRRVRELVSGMQTGGTHDAVWDLRDDNGQRLPAGVVFARLEVEGQALSERLVTLR